MDIEMIEVVVEFLVDKTGLTESELNEMKFDRVMELAQYHKLSQKQERDYTDALRLHEIWNNTTYEANGTRVTLNPDSYNFLVELADKAGKDKSFSMYEKIRNKENLDKIMENAIHRCSVVLPKDDYTYLVGMSNRNFEL